MGDEERNWLGLPTGDHWLDGSLERIIYDIDEIDDLIDEGLIRKAYWILEEFFEPEGVRETAEWYHLRARVQIGLSHGNYRLALRYSKKANELWPGNPRYEMLYDEIKARNQPTTLRDRIKGFAKELYNSAVGVLWSLYLMAFPSNAKSNYGR